MKNLLKNDVTKVSHSSYPFPPLVSTSEDVNEMNDPEDASGRTLRAVDEEGRTRECVRLLLNKVVILQRDFFLCHYRFGIFFSFCFFILSAIIHFLLPYIPKRENKLRPDHFPNKHSKDTTGQESRHVVSQIHNQKAAQRRISKISGSDVVLRM